MAKQSSIEESPVYCDLSTEELRDRMDRHTYWLNKFESILSLPNVPTSRVPKLEHARQLAITNIVELELILSERSNQ